MKPCTMTGSERHKSACMVLGQLLHESDGITRVGELRHDPVRDNYDMTFACTVL